MKKRMLMISALTGLSVLGLASCCIFGSADYTPEKPATIVNRLPAETRFAFMTDLQAWRQDFKTLVQPVDAAAYEQIATASEVFESELLALIDDPLAKRFIAELKNSQFYVMALPMDKPVRYLNIDAAAKANELASKLKALEEEAKTNPEADGEIDDDGLFDEVESSSPSFMDDQTWRLSHMLAIKMPCPELAQSVLTEIRKKEAEKPSKKIKVVTRKTPCGIEWFHVLPSAAGVISTPECTTIEHRSPKFPLSFGLCAYDGWLICATNTPEPLLKALNVAPEKSLADIGYGVPADAVGFSVGNLKAGIDDLQVLAEEFTRSASEADAAGDMSRASEIMVGKAVTEGMSMLRNVFELEKFAGFTGWQSKGMEKSTGKLYLTEAPTGGLKALLAPNVALAPVDYIGIDSAMVSMYAIDASLLFRTVIANLPAEVVPLYKQATAEKVGGKYTIEELVGLIRGDVYQYNVLPSFENLSTMLDAIEEGAELTDHDAFEQMGGGQVIAVGLNDPAKFKEVIETMVGEEFEDINGAYVSDEFMIRGDMLLIGQGELFKSIPHLQAVAEAQQHGPKLAKYGNGVNYYIAIGAKQGRDALEYLPGFWKMPKVQEFIQKKSGEVTGKKKILLDATVKYVNAILPPYVEFCKKYFTDKGLPSECHGKLEGNVYIFEGENFKR